VDVSEGEDVHYDKVTGAAGVSAQWLAAVVLGGEWATNGGEGLICFILSSLLDLMAVPVS
jgi:hypothetical protein